METQKSWYVIYTRSKWEKKVAGLLTKKGIENYCPLNVVSKQWSDRKKKVEEPLFNSYVFVHANESSHLPIQQTDGVVNFVYWLGKPAVVKDNEIEAIRQYLNNSYTLHLEKIKVNVNDTVQITCGPLMDREGNVLEVQHNTVKISLPSLGYAIIAAETAKIRKIILPAQAFHAIDEESRQYLSSSRYSNIYHESSR